MSATRIYTMENSTELERARRRFEIAEEDWERQFEVDHGFAPTIGHALVVDEPVKLAERDFLAERIEADERELAAFIGLPVSELL